MDSINTEQNSNPNFLTPPKISFLEAFYGILFKPKALLDDILKEDDFSILFYGAIAIFLANFGNVGPGNVNPFSIVMSQLGGYFAWICVGTVVFSLSLICKVENPNIGKVLGLIGLANIPFFLLTIISLISFKLTFIYSFMKVLVLTWSFVLFCLGVGKSLKLEPWRVVLLFIVPFLVLLVFNIFGVFFSSIGSLFS